MKELHINLTVTALTLFVICSIGALAEGLGKSLYQLEKKDLPSSTKRPEALPRLR